MKFVLAANGMQQVNEIPIFKDFGDKMKSEINTMIQQYFMNKVGHFFQSVNDWILIYGVDFVKHASLLVGTILLFISVMRTGKGIGTALKFLYVTAIFTLLESRLSI